MADAEWRRFNVERGGGGGEGSLRWQGSAGNVIFNIIRMSFCSVVSTPICADRQERSAVFRHTITATPLELSPNYVKFQDW